MKKIGLAVIFILSVVSCSLGTPAFASEVDSVLVAVKNAAPSIAEKVSHSGNLSIDNGKKVSQPKGIAVKSKSAEKWINISVDYADSIAGVTAEGTVLRGADPLVSAVVQETVNGFRVVTVIRDTTRNSRFEYTFAVPADAALVRTPTGYLLTDGDEVLGTLADPWATDASGRKLKTHYEWKNHVLAQVLDEEMKDLQYPVVLDPAWGYVYQYNLSFRPSVNMTRLKTCFNCYFPVVGAPRSYPKVGQLLPLTVGIFSFECTMGQTIQTADYAAFQFNATKNHVDGFGSNINFQFMQAGSINYMLVDAYIANSLDAIRAPYMASAGLNWQVFAWNLNSPNPRT